MTSRRSSAAVGEAGTAIVGAAPARPVLPRPAVRRSSLTPSYVDLVTVPTKAGLMFGSFSWSSLQPTSSRTDNRGDCAEARGRMTMHGESSPTVWALGRRHGRILARGLDNRATIGQQCAAMDTRCRAWQWLAAACRACLLGCAGSKDAAKGVEGTAAPASRRASSRPVRRPPGVVRLFDTRNGVQFQLQLVNVPTGTYRVALHEKGNCRSPNLFSAGPAWAPPESGRRPAELLPPFIVNTEWRHARPTSPSSPARAPKAPDRCAAAWW